MGLSWDLGSWPPAWPPPERQDAADGASVDGVEGGGVTGPEYPGAGATRAVRADEEEAPAPDESHGGADASE